MEKQVVLIAGGTGLIGKALSAKLRDLGHEVRILSRRPSDHSKQLFHWDPAKKEIDAAALPGVSTIINLSGAGIADKRWTEKRKKELLNSRVQPALFLASLKARMPELRQYISSSGVNAYGYDHPEKVYTEDDAFGKDFLSQIVQKWEEAADTFQPFCTVAKIRTSPVLAAKGSMLQTMEKPVKAHFAAALGSGKQWMPWIHIDDQVGIFIFAMEKRLAGSFHAVAQTTTNKAFTATLARQLHRKLWLPDVPAFLLKIALGEMASMVLEGVNVSSRKIREAGYQFKFDRLEEALDDLYRPQKYKAASIE